MNTCKITVLPNHVVLEAKKGEKLLNLLRDAGLIKDAPCGGNGTCGKCRVLWEHDGVCESILACQTMTDGDMTVRLPEDAKKTNILMKGLDVAVELNPVRDGYLLAYDIGTTTVVCFLLDGKTGEELASASMLNPQEPYGADVISRIQLALKGEMDALTRVIRRGMDSLARKACRDAGVDPAGIGTVAVVANPCMQQLFMGILPENLATVPFAPALVKSDAVPAKKYLSCCENAVLLVVPDISGYVGADTMGCVLSTRMYESEKLTLMVDIGTNGEMVLGNRDRLVACSTAAGPALEGAKIRFGMRGAEGAIDHVRWEDGKLCCSVIGGGEAKGICGSGLIDAIATLCREEIINRRGRIQTTEELDGERIVHLAGNVVLTQTDIREVQLAKGAIAAGIELMAETIGVSLEDIDTVLLAGAFGSFIDPESACEIGLLPKSLRGRITAVGNAAGSGSKIVACSRSELARADELAGKIGFIELAALEDFQDCFVDNMYF